MAYRVPRWLSDGLGTILDVLLPSPCITCGRTGSAMCAECLEAVERFRRPECNSCALPIPPDTTQVHSDECLRARSAVRAVRSAGPFDSTLRSAIHAFKYGDRPDAASPLASLLLAPVTRLIAGNPVATPWTLVPVPLHPNRIATRGYDQASLLALHLARAVDLPIDERLHRVRETAAQVGLGRRARLANMSGAFQFQGLPIIGTVILVDDVMTTGATLDQAARACLAAGCTDVCAVTLAREP